MTGVHIILNHLLPNEIWEYYSGYGKISLLIHKSTQVGPSKIVVQRAEGPIDEWERWPAPAKDQTDVGAEWLPYVLVKQQSAMARSLTLPPEGAGAGEGLGQLVLEEYGCSWYECMWWINVQEVVSFTIETDEAGDLL